MRQRKTVIIAQTATTFEEEREEILRAGCDDFLSKPFKESELFELMGKHLGIRFIYENTKMESEKESSKPFPYDSELVIPPQHELEVLYELTMFGNMLKVQEKAEYLEKN